MIADDDGQTTVQTVILVIDPFFGELLNRTSNWTNVKSTLFMRIYTENTETMSIIKCIKCTNSIES